MKKFFKCLVVALMLVAVCVPLTACKQDWSFLEVTQTEYVKFLDEVCEKQNQKYSVKEIDFSKFNAFGEDYKELENLYGSIYNLSLAYMLDFSNLLKVEPIVTGKNMEDDYNNLKNDCKKAVETYNKFVPSLETFYEKIKDEPNSVVSNQYLEEFKVSFLGLCKSFYNINTSLYNVISTYVYPSYDINDKMTESAKTNFYRLSTLNLSISYLDSTIAYLEFFEGNYAKLYSDNLFESVQDFYELYNTENVNYAELQTQDLLVIKNITETFRAEVKIFKSSINAINSYQFLNYYDFDFGTITDFAGFEDYTKLSTDNYYNLFSVTKFTQSSAKFVFDKISEFAN